jgi:hypothetical protein
LALQQGIPAPAWSVVAGPPGVDVDAGGRVSGWTPGTEELGSFLDFTIEASNSEGSDTESWQVLVHSPADFDLDGDVDLEDFGYLQACLVGSGKTHEPGCEDADLELDGDVDADDFALFQPCMAGANMQPGC